MELVLLILLLLLFGLCLIATILFCLNVMMINVSIVKSVEHKELKKIQ